MFNGLMKNNVVSELECGCIKGWCKIKLVVADELDYLTGWCKCNRYYNTELEWNQLMDWNYYKVMLQLVTS